MGESALMLVVRDDERILTTVTVDSGGLLVGSAAHCDVRLSATQVAAEQLFFQLSADGSILAHSRDPNTLVSLKGAAFARGIVPEGSSLQIGRLSLVPSVVAARTATAAKPNQRGSRLRLLAMALLAVVGIVLMKPAKESSAATFMKAPALFDSNPVQCSEAHSDLALAAVAEWLAEARDLHERSPFAPQSGIQAVELYQRAGACLERFGPRSAAEEAAQSAADLQRRLELDFHAHRVRLARALEAKNAAAAAREVALVRSFIGDRTGPFSDWLSTLSRKLGLQLGQKSGKKGKQVKP